ncbi:hypothetical protein [Methylobacterium flocculans]|uniref:hypothetical protein n=1 Tax=Methylobacterium flocculans TaxID=2984843 RepID=UPI0021F3ACB3|nr:hypothetical protein [Methylobacterium sp. FF17]
MSILIKAGLAVVAFLALAWAGIATYDHVYDAGVAAEHAKTQAVETKLDAMTDRALQAEATAKDNETAALALGQSLTDQAAAYDAHDASAKSDADAYTAALDAARRARCPDVPDPIPGAIHGALTGIVTPEDAPLPGSLKAAIRDLKRRGK